MSADLDKIYTAIVANGNRLTAIETTQSLRHVENQTAMKSLSKTVESVIKLKTHVTLQWFFIGGIFAGIITLFVRNL